jgi:hypothetical protein
VGTTAEGHVEVSIRHREILARAIHDEYVRNQSRAGDTPERSNSLISWDELPEDLKESNRRQADHIGAKLREIGAAIEPHGDEESIPFRFEPDEVELLAEMEHVRWNQERTDAGWTYGHVTDHAGRKSPSLIPWPNLPEHEKEKDRNAVRGIPALLARVGLGIVRVSRRT